MKQPGKEVGTNRIDTEYTKRLLEACLDLLGKYEGYMNTLDAAHYDSRRIPELRDRLRQVIRTFDRIVTLTGRTVDATIGLLGFHIDEATAVLTPDLTRTLLNPEAMKERDDLDQDLLLLTEAFYNTAWRLREIMHPKRCGLPGLCGFEAIGVRNVRNHIMLHPEPMDVARPLWSHGLSKDRGPTLGGAHEGQTSPKIADAGLYINAQEFAERLHHRLSDALVGHSA